MVLPGGRFDPYRTTRRLPPACGRWDQLPVRARGRLPRAYSTRSACNNELLASILQPLATRGIAEVNAAAAEATINAAVDAAAESVSDETVAETVAAAAETVASGAAETVVEAVTLR